MSDQIFNKKSSLMYVLVVSILGFFVMPAYAEVTIKVHNVRGSVSMLTGQGGNIGVSAGDDGVFMIDDQFAPLSRKITDAIESISDEPIRFLLNTHWHSDHTGGNENFGRAGATIIAHENVRKLMSTNQEIKFFKAKIPARTGAALPVITFNDRATFFLNDEQIEVRHLPPAHTNGDSFVIFKVANVIHTGDVFFNGIYPFIDREHGGSLAGMIQSAKIIASYADDETKIIPGHGAMANKADLLRFIDMLSHTKKQLDKAKQSGKSIAQIIADKPLAEISAQWGKGFLSTDNFITMLLTEY